ncbi:MAG: hypothetical protein KGL25_02480 [Gammaproteobacteria bacterium]|nr:hypothetical protein [Gammaproteobacteria bacterium]MDE2250257.1 hypothetical protein [Gammaproteobacteria bacterium]
MQVRARMIASSLAPAGACAQLAKHWGAGANAGWTARCQRVGRWLLVSHPVGRFVEAAQLEADADGSIGFLSAVDPFAAHASGAHPRLPLPAGARLVNTVRSDLDRDSVFQFTIELPWTPAVSLARLRGLARKSGWVAAAAPASDVVDFQRGDIAARAIGLGSARGCSLLLIEHRPAGHAP